MNGCLCFPRITKGVDAAPLGFTWSGRGWIGKCSSLQDRTRCTCWRRLMDRLYGVPPKDFLQESTLDKERKQTVLAAVQEVVEDNGTRRSALLRWMIDNHDEFF